MIVGYKARRFFFVKPRVSTVVVCVFVVLVRVTFLNYRTLTGLSCIFCYALFYRPHNNAFVLLSGSSKIRSKMGEKDTPLENLNFHIMQLCETFGGNC